MIAKPHADIGRQTSAQGCLIKHGAVPFDHAAAFKLLYPAQAGRRGQPHLVSQLQIGDAAVGGEDAQYIISSGVFMGHILQCFRKIVADSNL